MNRRNFLQTLASAFVAASLAIRLKPADDLDDLFCAGNRFGKSLSDPELIEQYFFPNARRRVVHTHISEGKYTTLFALLQHSNEQPTELIDTDGTKFNWWGTNLTSPQAE